MALEDSIDKQWLTSTYISFQKINYYFFNKDLSLKTYKPYFLRKGGGFVSASSIITSIASNLMLYFLQRSGGGLAPPPGPLFLWPRVLFEPNRKTKFLLKITKLNK